MSASTAAMAPLWRSMMGWYSTPNSLRSTAPSSSRCRSRGSRFRRSLGMNGTIRPDRTIRYPTGGTSTDASGARPTRRAAAALVRDLRPGSQTVCIRDPHRVELLGSGASATSFMQEPDRTAAAEAPNSSAGSHPLCIPSARDHARSSSGVGAVDSARHACMGVPAEGRRDDTTIEASAIIPPEPRRPIPPCGRGPRCRADRRVPVGTGTRSQRVAR